MAFTMPNNVPNNDKDLILLCFSRNNLLSAQKFLKPVDPFFNIFHRGCIGNPDVLIRPERGARDEGDMRLFE